MKFEDPMLLTVKMFLSEVRSWRLEYRFPNYVCTDFAKVIFDAATVKGMRCGYALVFFEGSRTSHAIVAFNTDHGLVYIEPQTGEQESIEIEKPYPSRLKGVPIGCPVSAISIAWNDELEMKYIECSNCGYLLPICCPICGKANINLISRDA